MKKMKNFWLILLLFLAFSSGPAFPGSVMAQNDVITSDDEEEEEESDEEWELVEYPEALVVVNGNEQAITENFQVERNQTLTVQIQRLQPRSWVAVHIEKAGVKLEKMRWDSNEKGEIELEVQTGKSKVKGSAEIWYTPSNGHAKNIKVQVQVI